jgi:hypothetical protein
MLRTIVAFLACAPLALAAQSGPQGRWEGAIRIPDRELRIFVDLAQSGDGMWRGSLILPSLDVKGAPVTALRVDGDAVTFEFRGPFAVDAERAARFMLRAKGAGTMEGELRHAGNVASVALHRSGAAQVEAERVSTPVAAAIAGRWVGEYELGGYPRQVTIIVRNDARVAAAEWTIVGKQTTRLPVDYIAQDGEFVRIESQPFRAAFEARLVDDALRGVIELGSIELPVVFRRAKDLP